MKEELQAAWHAETASLFLRAGKPFAKFREKKLMFPMETDGTAEKILCKNKKNKNGMEDEMEKGIQILVVEDDPDINGLILRILRKQGYQVTQAFSGTEAGLWLGQKEYDLMILDLMLPGLTGEELIAEIRKDKTMPVIVISARTALEDKISLLKLGADDYITKPFETGEVAARVEAQLRRYMKFTGKEEGSRLHYKDLEVNEQSMEASLKGRPLSLTQREFQILALLMKHPKTVFTRENIYQQVWEDSVYVEDNTVNVHISNLRAKLARIDKDTEYIKTVWGIGFKMADQ